MSATALLARYMCPQIGPSRQSWLLLSTSLQRAHPARAGNPAACCVPQRAGVPAVFTYWAQGAKVSMKQPAGLFFYELACLYGTAWGRGTYSPSTVGQQGSSLL